MTWTSQDKETTIGHGPVSRGDTPDRYTASMTEFIPAGSRFVELPTPFAMKRGGALHGARMAYETWGELNADGDTPIPAGGKPCSVRASRSTPTAGSCSA